MRDSVARGQMCLQGWVPVQALQATGPAESRLQALLQRELPEEDLERPQQHGHVLQGEVRQERLELRQQRGHVLQGEALEERLELRSAAGLSLQGRRQQLTRREQAPKGEVLEEPLRGDQERYSSRLDALEPAVLVPEHAPQRD